MKSTATTAVGVADHASSAAGTSGLEAELRSHGFDLRRSVWVTHLVGTRHDREAAFAVGRKAAVDGWQTSLYADSSGWVVRVSRLRVLRPTLIGADRLYVERLAGANGGIVRGFTVEDLAHTDDCWETLADRVQRPAAHSGPTPTSRRKRREPARLSRSA